MRVFFYCFRVLIMSVMMVGQTDTDERNSFVYVYVVVCVCVCVFMRNLPTNNSPKSLEKTANTRTRDVVLVVVK